MMPNFLIKGNKEYQTESHMIKLAAFSRCSQVEQRENRLRYLMLLNGEI